MFQKKNKRLYSYYYYWWESQFVAATQPINSLTFVLDGVNFGASDFAYTAYSMVRTILINQFSQMFSFSFFFARFSYILMWFPVVNELS